MNLVDVIPAPFKVIPARPYVIPERSHTIPAIFNVIPAKAGILQWRHRHEIPGQARDDIKNARG